MAGSYCPYVSGPALVKINLRDSNGWVNLGYTTEGVQVEETLFTNPIHSDQYGGTAGPPVDKQFMGKSARISLSLVEFSIAVAKRLRESQASLNWTTGVPGTITNVGGLVTCGKRAFQVLLVGAADAAAVAADAQAITLADKLNFPNCWYAGPIRYNVASKNTTLDFDIEATPFTTDTTQSGDGKTYLWMQNDHLITTFATYAGTTQTAESAP
jgi:hypothetical protein